MAQVFILLEKIDSNTTQIIMGAPLNMRLGTHGLNMSELAAEAGRQNMTLDEVMAIPEQNNFTYDLFWHDGPALVCSGLVAELWKAGGLFGNLTINAGEFVPRDNYELKFFDSDFVYPEECNRNGGDKGFCQILGKYHMGFPNLNTIEPYDNMAENCPSIGPDYIRVPGC
jgi:hypothetical protein